MRDYTGAITLAEVMGIRSLNFKYENFRVFPWQYGGMKSEQGRSIFTHKPSHPLPLLMEMIVFFSLERINIFFGEANKIWSSWLKNRNSSHSKFHFQNFLLDDNEYTGKSE